MSGSTPSSRRTRGWLCAVGFSLLALLCAVAAAPASAAPVSQYQHADEVLVRHYTDVESSLLDINPVPIRVQEVHAIPNAVGDSEPLDARGLHVGPETHCLIRFASYAHNGPLADIQGTAAHEVFHCLSAQFAPNLVTFYDHTEQGGKWLIEGAAAWVEADLVPGDRDARDWWFEYLDSPGRPLFSRAYDAIGFFGHLAQSGIDPWHVFRAMFSVPGNVAPYQASGATNGSALDSEASEFFGSPELGDAWTAWHQGDEIADSNVPRSHQGMPTVAVPRGHTRTLTAKPYADGGYLLMADAPITTLEVDGIGYARLHSIEGPDVNVTHISTLTLCEVGHPCRCPDGSHPPNAVSFKAGDLAITGGPNGSAVKITATCELPPEPCSDLNLAGDFAAPTGGYMAAQLTGMTGVSGGFPGLISGSGCTVAAFADPIYQLPDCVTPMTSNPDCIFAPLGSYDLLNFDTDQDAENAFPTLVNDELFDSPPSPVDVGEEADVSDLGGVVQFENDIFAIQWGVRTSSVDPASVLGQVVDTLCPSCTS